MSRDRFDDTFDRFQPPERGRFGDNEHAPPSRASAPRVTGASDLKDIELFQHAKTARGVLVSDGRHGTVPKWLPLSEVEIEDTGRSGRVWNDDRREHAAIVTVTVPRSLAREKGLI